MKTVMIFAMTVAFVATYTQAAIIGSEVFNSYADGAIAGQTGGTGWDWDNVGKTNSLTLSDWDNSGGAPQVSSQTLLTSGGNSAKREFNGPVEGSGGGDTSDTERSGAFRGAGTVYFRSSLKWITDNDWSGISWYDFSTERVFFGVPGGQTGTKYFAIDIKPGVDNSGKTFSTVAASVGQTYDIVAEINFNSDVVRIWVDPASGNDAPAAARYTAAANWLTSVRVGSSGSSQWDNLLVATHWSDLGLTPKSGILLYEGFAGYTATNLPGQIIQGEGFRYGSTWTGDSADESTFETNGLTYPYLVVAEGSGKATTKGDGGPGTSAFLDLGAFDRAGVLGSDTYTGTTSGESRMFIGGSDVEAALYYSFLAKSNTGQGSSAFAGFQLYRDSSEVCLTGLLFSNPAYSGFAPQGSEFNLNSANSDRSNDNFENVDTNIHLFVVRIDYHANAADDITIWLDPEVKKGELEQSTALKTVRTAAGDLSFNKIHLRSGNGTNSWSFDEIRFGTDWRSVLPLIEHPAGTIILIY